MVTGSRKRAAFGVWSWWARAEVAHGQVSFSPVLHARDRLKFHIRREKVKLARRFLFGFVCLILVFGVVPMAPGIDASSEESFAQGTFAEEALPGDEPLAQEPFVHETPPTLVPPEEDDSIALPENVSGDWWSTVQEDIRQSEYDITWQKDTSLPNLSAAYQAPNRAQNLRTYFTSEGVRMISRTEALPTWELGLALAGYGYESDIQPLAVAERSVTDNRIEYSRCGGKKDSFLVNGTAVMSDRF